MHDNAISFDQDTGKLSLLVTDEKLLRWPDGLSIYHDSLYITASAIHYILKGEHQKAAAPFHLLKVGLPDDPSDATETEGHTEL